LDLAVKLPSTLWC